MEHQGMSGHQECRHIGHQKSIQKKKRGCIVASPLEETMMSLSAWPYNTFNIYKVIQVVHSKNNLVWNNTYRNQLSHSQAQQLFRELEGGKYTAQTKKEHWNLIFLKIKHALDYSLFSYSKHGKTCSHLHIFKNPTKFLK